MASSAAFCAAVTAARAATTSGLFMAISIARAASVARLRSASSMFLAICDVPIVRSARTVSGPAVRPASTRHSLIQSCASMALAFAAFIASAASRRLRARSAPASVTRLGSSTTKMSALMSAGRASLNAAHALKESRYTAAAMAAPSNEEYSEFTTYRFRRIWPVVFSMVETPANSDAKLGAAPTSTARNARACTPLWYQYLSSLFSQSGSEAQSTGGTLNSSEVAMSRLCVTQKSASITPMAGATSSEPTPTTQEDAAMTCCQVSARGAAASAMAATTMDASLPDMGLMARTDAMGPTDAAVELVTRHAAITTGRHTTAGAEATPEPAIAARPASAGSHNACALRNDATFTARRA
mmetsp:Transcript_14990/g.64207  ORF Transcript_14990/g.64207 Transcript_14990/m.64207 type:complete len:356 (+) Transcript_14990:771-1838(+)